MQEALIYCFIVVVFAMGAFVASSGPATRERLLRSNEESNSKQQPTTSRFY
jgi:hypothetical protein